jgi:hypothetical protein
MRIAVPAHKTVVNVWCVVMEDVVRERYAVDVHKIAAFVIKIRELHDFRTAYNNKIVVSEETLLRAEEINIIRDRHEISITTF